MKYNRKNYAKGEIKMYGKIYCISNDINDKVYIGKTLSSLENRFQEHCKDSVKERCEKRPLYNAMNKYGIEHFSISLVEEVPIEELDSKEQYWIAQYNSYSFGYNATVGGDGKQLYDYRLFVEDYNNGMLIKDIADKHCCDTHTVTDALKLYGIDTKKNNLDRQKHLVHQYDKTGNYIQSFESYRAAARYLIDSGESAGKVTSIATNIGRVIKGERKTAEGYVWKAVE